MTHKVSMNFLYQQLNEWRNTHFLETNGLKSKAKKIKTK
jgi:hypothetical protein